MNFKDCPKCETNKNTSEFYKDKSTKTGLKSQCKECCKSYNKTDAHKKSVAKYHKTDKWKAVYTRQNNSVKVIQYQKKYSKIYCKTKKGKVVLQNAKYKYNHSDYGREKNNEYKREKRANDLQFLIMSRVRCRLYNFLNSNNIHKNNTTILSIGCSKEQLINWIEYNLEIDNLEITDCNLDHLTPLTSFNCETYDEVIESKCNHWTNLIPILELDNQIKNDRPPTKHELFKQELRIFLFNKSIQ